MTTRRAQLRALAAWLAWLAPATAGAGSPVDFALSVRPVLSRLCFSCHGPDVAQRKAGLRLDTEEEARKDLGGYAAFVPGFPARSEALTRMRSADPDDRMPPPGTGKQATEEELSLLERWVRQGARMTGHWSWAAPRRRPVPPAFWPELASNPVGHFIQARLPARSLAPAPAAAPATLLRRLALDLTGLPPTPAELARFTADPGERAYRAQVERYLDSFAYGERWARVWLDLARYADSKGYEKDRPRVMWRYRDWLIDALDHDMPHDRFTTLQLAGDLVPGASPATRLAPAFHRNTRCSATSPSSARPARASSTTRPLSSSR